MVQRKKPHPSRPVVLLTGFDAFGGEQVNPSWLAVKAMHGKQLGGHRLVAAQLPTVFGQALIALELLLKQKLPTLILCVGQAGGRRSISFERVAVNVNDARIADNAGQQPVDTPVVPGAPAAYFSTLPIKAMALALQQQGISAEVSQTAGTFVCNHVFFGLMHELATRHVLKNSRGGFVHVPYLPEQAAAQVPGQNLPSMPLEEIARGLRLAVRTALLVAQDIKLSAGALH